MPDFGTAQPHSLLQPRKSLKPRCLGACSQEPPQNSPWGAGKGPPRVTLGLGWEIFLSEPEGPPFSQYIQ